MSFHSPSRVIGLLAVAGLAACTSTEPTRPTELKTLPFGIAKWEGQAGFINICKSGPAGTYYFSASVQGGGDYVLADPMPLEIVHSGIGHSCGRIFTAANAPSWDPNLTAQVTVTEVNIPAGVFTQKIELYDLETSQLLATYQNTSSVTLTIGYSNFFGLAVFNAEAPPPPPPVVANCSQLSGTIGVPLTPVQLTASGGTGGPYTFTASGLPAGITLSTSGVLSGTPQASGTFSYTVTVTDNSGNTGTSGSCSVVIAPPPFCSYTPGGWGAPPNGGNVASILYANFSSLYSSGVTIGTTGQSGYYNAKFTTATAVTNYLPDGGTPGVLKANLVNPLTTVAGEFASQVLALRFNVNFSAAGIIKPGFNTATVVGGPLAGLTTTQVLALAQAALGGNTGVLAPYGITVAQFTKILSGVNGNYDNCSVNNGYLQ